MDDAAVVSRLVGGDPVLLLEDEDAEAVVAEQGLAGDREPENPRADDDEVRRRDCRGHASITATDHDQVVFDVRGSLLPHLAA